MTDRADSNASASQSMRLDKWLWHARFFKSRSQATDATVGGRVHVNGERAKPARDIKVGDCLEISREEQRFEVTVIGLPTRRGPASEAQQSYAETPASIQQREQKREHQRYAAPAPAGRPNKHDRRALRSMKGW